MINDLNFPTNKVKAKDLINILPTAIYICDLSGRLTYFNEAAVKLLGRTPEIGKDMWCGSWKIYYPNGEPMPLDKSPMARCLMNETAPKAEEIIIEKPDGMKLNILTHPMPIKDKDKKIKAYICVLTDISDKKLKEQKLGKIEKKYKKLSLNLQKKIEERTITLKKSEERYHKMINEVQDYAILLLDINGNIQNWNLGAEKIKGYKESEILGKNFRTFYLDKDRKNKFPEKLINEAKKNGRAMHEGWRLRKDGTKFWGYIVITALHDENGQVIGFSKVTRDLTERKKAEDKLLEYAKDIEIRNKQLEEYAYIASHDLQEPLRKIQIFSELIEENLSNDKVVKLSLSKIKASAVRMSKLIKDVLKYSQVTQQMDLFKKVDLNETLKNVKEDFELLIQEKNVKINSAELPKMKGIPMQIHQLFSNLIGNSIKFSEQAPIINISSEELTPSQISKYPLLNSNKKYVKLTIADNGPGFEERFKNRIFKLFQRLNNSKYGTGIGLALCKKIVDNHQGIINVESQLNKGTTFYIVLPIEQ